MRTSSTVQGVFLVGLLATVSTATAAWAAAGTRTSAATPTSWQSKAVSGPTRTCSLGVRPALRAITVGRAPQAVAVAEQTHRVFVANAGDNSLSVLDTRTGAVLRRIAVGAAPAAVAVDEPTRRVFVAEAGANSVRVFDAFWTLAHAAIDD